MANFWAKVRVDLDGCWEWTAYRDRDGYGLFGESKGNTVRAHRYAYEMVHPELLKGEPLDHLCRNRACVRPAHLERVTVKINNEHGLKARQTHCVHGHLFDVANTYIKPNGTRKCRTCHVLAQRKYRQVV